MAFQKLFSKNRRYSAKGISLIVYHTREIEKPEIAVCVSHKKGNAVIRNRLKRITREGIDIFINDITGKCYLAFLPDLDFNRLDFNERKISIKKLLIDSGLIKNGQS